MSETYNLIRKYINENILLLDGGMGTTLQSQGMQLGVLPESLNITAPDQIACIHASYIESGSKMILTNTFGANRKKLAKSGYTVSQVISAGVEVAKKSANGNCFVALDIGPIGELLEPLSTLSFESAYDIFKEQMLIGYECGADAIFIETMTDLYEVKAAVLAAKENTPLPVFCCMSFENNMRTFVGTSISSMAMTLEGLGVDALGINCSLGPVEISKMVPELVRWTSLPVIVKPNAGLPAGDIDGTIKYSIDSEKFAEAMKDIVLSGASIIGGCCGTTPEHIKKIRTLCSYKKKNTPVPQISAACSASETVIFDKVRVIGERINPTGREDLQNALKGNDMQQVIRIAAEQVRDGAEILDVNLGVPGLDESLLLTRAVKSLQSVVSVPLQIDTSCPKAAEAAFRAYNGKAILNSVNGDDEILESFLPIVKKYGGCVIGLTLDKNGIPSDAEGRLVIAEKILMTAEKYGIKRADLIIDPLTLTAGAQQSQAKETLLALRLITEKLKLKTTLGVSNISFGLPMRSILNSSFLLMALTNGLTLPIINPGSADMMNAIYCFNQLMDIDKNSLKYIERFSSGSEFSSQRVSRDRNICSADHGIGSGDNFDKFSLIRKSINSGMKQETVDICRNLLAEYEELTIINEVLIPILDDIGDRYEKGQIFLPQLLNSAETAKEAFMLINKSISSKRKIAGTEDEKKEKIILATVKGDIHDIGKNIVKVVLENYGYEIIDLGKDVEIQTIVDTARERDVKLVGLSALMTTTVKSMKSTIDALKNNGIDCKTFVGGAVLTEDYANSIGADYYAKDARQSVIIANRFFGKNNK